MRVGIATDHGGFELKEDLVSHLRQAGHEVVDFGRTASIPVMTAKTSPSPWLVQYLPARWSAVWRSAEAAWAHVSAPPKFLGFRAGLVQDHYSAHQRVEHDDMKILCIGGRVVGPLVAEDLVDTFLATDFSRGERHVRRLRKIAELEVVSK